MLNANSDVDVAREGVTEQVLSADSSLETESAKIVLREWMKAHPNEQGMREGFEQLYTIQGIIEHEQAEHARSGQHSA